MATEYISRKEAIRAVRDQTCWRYNNSAIDEIGILGNIEKLPAANVVDKAEWDKLLVLVEEANKALEATRWIPVSERLPEDLGTKLVFGYGSLSSDKGFGVGQYEPSLSRWFVDGQYDGEWESFCVTHWMPLPEPPK